jgi:hypothetical protein
MTSGKTTAANYLLEIIPNSKRLALAGPVYDMVNNIDKDPRYLVDTYILPYYDPRDLIQQKMGLEIPESFYSKWEAIVTETRTIPLENPKPRKRLQFLGTDGARKKIDNEIWIKMAGSKANQSPDINWVIDDCRFRNEYKWFENNNWQPIYLFVSKKTQKKRIENLYGQFDPSILEHPSEAEIAKICIPTECIINADQPLDDMTHDIKEFLWTKENLS